MPHFSLKKLLPSKRTWKAITITLQSKLRNLSIPKPVKTATRRVLALRSLPLRLFFFRPFKRGRHTLKNQSYVPHKTFSTIFIDQLYEQGTSKGNENETCDEKKRTIYSIDDAWKAVVAASPQLRGVDERADEFISKFREDMKLQKEKSMLEFQEMLARGS